MGLLARLRRSLSAPDALLEEALARAAARVDPRLTHAPHWPGRYRPPLEAALTQARRVAQAVPGPVTLDRDHWARDPFVRALFPSAEAIEQAIANSVELERHMASTRAGTPVYALLSLRREEREIFGMELDGEILRRDVPQKVVMFSDPRFLAPAPDESAARKELMWAFYERFLERVAVGVARLRAEQERLREEKDLIQARMRGAPPSKRAELQSALAEVLDRLGEMAHHLDPTHWHEVFETVLSHPEDCLYLEEHEYILDAMGVVGAVGTTATTVRFVDLIERYQEPRTVALVAFPAVAPHSLADRLDQADHWL